MKIYTHLTESERYHIYLMNEQHYVLTEIATTMGRNKSTISREIKPNTGGNGYRHKQAHNFVKQKNKRIKLKDGLRHLYHLIPDLYQLISKWVTLLKL